MRTSFNYLRAVPICFAVVWLFAASDARADLLVSGLQSHQIHRYDDNGNLLGAFASQTPYPSGMAIGGDGHLYVASRLNTVLRYHGLTGTFLGAFVPGGSGGIARPDGITFGPDGDLFVTTWTSTLPDIVLRYQGGTGNPLGTFTQGGELNTPYGLKFGPDGNMYVSSSLGGEVFKYDGQTGAYLGAIVHATLHRPYGLAFGPDGDLYASSHTYGQVVRFDPISGAFKGVFASGGGLSAPSGLTFGPGGDLFVCDAINDRVLRYDGVTGAFEGVFAAGGGLSEPTDLLFTIIPEPVCLFVPVCVALLIWRRRGSHLPG